ncbi:HNH endonuclease family protein [Streptomyces zaomyceticus]
MIRTAGVLVLALSVVACAPREATETRPTASALPLVTPGFPPTPARARSRLAALEVARGENWRTYERAKFGKGWSDETDAPGGRNGCDTRDDVLHRDLDDVRLGDRNPCVVLRDPYTGEELPYSYRKASQIQTDHVVALGAAWRAGAWAWTPERRLSYANDLDVLLATDKRTNYDKSGKTPDKWRPPRTAYWCEYGRRWTGIKAKYRLTVSPPEKKAVEELLATCR